MAFPSLRLQSKPRPVEAPDTVAGHELTAEERELVAKYLATYEKHIGPLRQQELPNDLPPDFHFTSPPMKAAEAKQ
jgi:hypothetical protein